MTKLIAMAILIFCATCAMAQFPTKAQCEETSSQASKLITAFDKQPDVETSSHLAHEAETIAIQIRGCRMLAMSEGNIGMVNLYADDETWLLAGMYDAAMALAKATSADLTRCAEDYSRKH
jgi:hypothetical protein